MGNVWNGTSVCSLINLDASVSFLMHNAAAHLKCVYLPAAPIIRASEASELKYSGSDSSPAAMRPSTWYLKIPTERNPSCRVVMHGSYSFAKPAGSSHAATSATIVSERRSVHSNTLLTAPLVLRSGEDVRPVLPLAPPTLRLDQYLVPAGTPQRLSTSASIRTSPAMRGSWQPMITRDLA